MLLPIRRLAEQPDWRHQNQLLDFIWVLGGKLGGDVAAEAVAEEDELGVRALTVPGRLHPGFYGEKEVVDAFLGRLQLEFRTARRALPKEVDRSDSEELPQIPNHTIMGAAAASITMYEEELRPLIVFSN